MEDALGKKIEIGKWYGYSVNQRGMTKTIIGIVVAINTEKVTLKPKGIWEALYTDKMQCAEIKGNTSVRANRLFPVRKADIGHEELKFKPNVYKNNFSHAKLL